MLVRAVLLMWMNTGFVIGLFSLTGLVPVYRNHRLVHLHVPKTAGTAIEELFARVGDMTWDEHCWYGAAQHSGRFWEYQHLTALELRRLSLGSFDGYTTFAVVRDPLERLISDFEWRRAVAANGSSHVQSFDSFDEFLAAIPVDLDGNWDRYIALADRRRTNLLIHIRPQWHYVCGPGAEPDDRIVVIHYENLHDGLAPLFDAHSMTADLDRRPPSTRRLTDYYSADTAQQVIDTYRTDMNWFGYSTPVLDTLPTDGIHP